MRQHTRTPVVFSQDRRHSDANRLKELDRIIAVLPAPNRPVPLDRPRCRHLDICTAWKRAASAHWHDAQFHRAQRHRIKCAPQATRTGPCKCSLLASAEQPPQQRARVATRRASDTRVFPAEPGALVTMVARPRRSAAVAATEALASGACAIGRRSSSPSRHRELSGSQCTQDHGPCSHAWASQAQVECRRARVGGRRGNPG